MRLILVRHGESEWNRDGRILGRADIPLSELGLRQARAVAKALQRESIQAVYCSPLKRAMETGRMIAQNQGCLLISDPDLQELDRGNLMGMTREEAFTAFPSVQETWPEVGSAPGLHGQESLEQLNLRARECLGRICAEHTSETVTLVGHYFVNLVILLNLLGMHPRCFRSFGQDIAAINKVEFEGGRPRIRLLNDTCHLRGG